MLKSKAITSLALAGVMLMGAGSMVHAAEPTQATIKSGETNVIYDNRQTLPDSNGMYGMIIPAGISFTDDDYNSPTGRDASVSIVGINGYDLSEWTDLDVSAKVASKNSYSLNDESGSNNGATYELKMTGNDAAFTANASAQDITEHIGVGGALDDKAEGKATLTSRATKKGVYKDVLTYTFTENKNSYTGYGM